MLWKNLYNTVWIAFLCCTLLPRWLALYKDIYPGAPIHLGLGALLVFMTVRNARKLGALPDVPARLKRISKTTMGLAIFSAVIGIAFGAVKNAAPDQTIIINVLRGIHVVCALAILAQSASVATGYDMWEEKELGPQKS